MILRAASGFDRLAPVYDGLARLFFGKEIVNSQTCYLREIPPGSAILILGGGTGWLLAELLRVVPACEVCYVDASREMISRSRAMTNDDARVQFIRGTEADIPDRVFDVIITHFFLDLFPPVKLRNVVRKIAAVGSASAIWLAADFRKSAWWHGLFLGLMYFFFHWTCQIEAGELPPWDKILKESHVQVIERRLFYKGFIASTLYHFRGVH